jgi:DNA-binding NarL/FixJ family response regulator
MTTVRTSGESPSGSVLVWLVEDRAFFRETVQALLNNSGSFACPLAFQSCEECIDALRKEVLPDVILLDIELPGMNGIEGIAHFKALSPETEIVILTVYDDDEKVFSALCAGASGYLLKNSPKEKILDGISEVLQGGAPMNPTIARKVLTLLGGAHSAVPDYGLTEREKQILQLLVSGESKKKIADKMFLSYHTINAHIRNIYGKLHVNTRSGAISKAFKERLVR